LIYLDHSFAVRIEVADVSKSVAAAVPVAAPSPSAPGYLLDRLAELRILPSPVAVTTLAKRQVSL
jgi:hypothetical protein